MIDIFSKFGWTIPLRKKSSQRIKDSIKTLPIGSKRFPNLIETERGKQISNNFFNVFLNKSSIKRYGHYISLLAVYVKKYNRTIRRY